MGLEEAGLLKEGGNNSNEMRYMTPEKRSLMNSDIKLRKFNTPETMFTPLKIPGVTKSDGYEKKHAVINSSCYSIPDF